MILLSKSPGEKRSALVQDGVLREYLIYRSGAPDGFGDRYVGRIAAHVPAMAGSFVTLPSADGFLPDSEAFHGLSEGSYVIVEVTRCAQGGKGPRVAARPGRAEPPIRRLESGPSPMMELCDAYPDEPVKTIGAFPEDLEADIAALAEPEALLAGGVKAHFAQTPGACVIDLDMAGATAMRQSKPRAQFAANEAAIPDLIRQIVLRNISGVILVDPAGLPTRKRVALASVFNWALAADRAQPRLAGFSNLGFAEILRPRRRPPLLELLNTPHGRALAALREAEWEGKATPSRRLALRARPEVLDAIRADSGALKSLNHVLVHPLTLIEDRQAARWRIEDAHA